MRNVLIVLLSLLLSACSLRSDGLPGDVLLKIRINGVSYEKEFDLDYQDGLAIITSAQIDEELDIISQRNAYSYIDRKKVQIDVPDLEKVITFSSFNHNQERLISNYALGFADASRYKKTTFQFLGTTFNLVTKTDSPINHAHFKTSINRLWSVFINRLGSSSDVLTLVELERSPKSDLPIGENFLPITNNDSLIHILTYTYFGFGQTREKVKSEKELWFSLGMGAFYDVEITRIVTKKNIPVKRPSLTFIKKLESAVGPITFNRAVRKYLFECSECTGGYNDFKKFLSAFRYQVQKVERDFLK